MPGAAGVVVGVGGTCACAWWVCAGRVGTTTEVATVAKPCSRAAVAQVRPDRQVGEGSDEGGLPTFGVLRATLGPHSRAGVSISMEGVGGRTAWSLGCDEQL